MAQFKQKIRKGNNGKVLTFAKLSDITQLGQDIKTTTAPKFAENTELKFIGFSIVDWTSDDVTLRRQSGAYAVICFDKTNETLAVSNYDEPAVNYAGNEISALEFPADRVAATDLAKNQIYVVKYLPYITKWGKVRYKTYLVAKS